MTEFLWPMILAVWHEEKIPAQWNEGLITSLYKGKGDREVLNNHRPITVSSAIGTILEELIDERIKKIVPLTQAQAGGQTGMSTCDHVFIVRAIIAIAIKQKRNVFLTFFDVAKAYDNACSDNMLAILWDRGFRGKIWRILHGLSKNLRARIKTRYGITRSFGMEIGGRQGSRLTGRMFSKQMDVISEELINNQNDCLEITSGFSIGALLWIDDLITCTEDTKRQEIMLKRVDEFAKKNKVRWGREKCKVMQVGRKNDQRTEWQFGDITIGNCDEYKYLGDIITSNGKNQKNIEARKSKLLSSTIHITAIGSNEVLRSIQASTLIALHETMNVPKLMINAETWILSKGNTKELNRIEVQCLKRLFSLPSTTPTASVIFSFGVLFTSVRIDKKQLLYLHKILHRQNDHWTLKLLYELEKLNTGWTPQIKAKLKEYGLEESFVQIKSKSRIQWKREVESSIEAGNKEKLLDECHEMKLGEKRAKTKTAFIVEKVNMEDYKRQPMEPIEKLNRYEAKLLILSRFHMLECGKNFKGTLPEICPACSVTDDEQHRLNQCTRYERTNFCNSDEKHNFDDVYDSDVSVVKEILKSIERVWNVKTGHGSMVQVD